MSPAAHLALSATLVFLVSCQVKPAPFRMADAGVALPDSWITTKEARAGVDAHWIKDFNDPALEQLVREAMANNPSLSAMRARVDQAAGRVRLAGADAKPGVDLNFNPSRTKRNFVGFPFGEEGTEAPSLISNSYQLSLDIRWELDVWGRILASQRAALADYEVSGWQEQAARTSLAGQIAKTWFALLEANEQVALAQQARETFQKTAGSVRERFEAGAANPGQAGAGWASQLRIAESDVASANAELVQFTEARDNHKRNLEILLGRYPSAQLLSRNNLPPSPSAPKAGLPSELLLRRPDILAAERTYAAAGMRLKEARRAVFPRFSLTASGGTSSEDLHQILNSNFGVWNLAGNIVQTIFAQGVLKAEADIRSAAERESLAELQKTVLEAFGEVENALDAEAKLAERQTYLQEANRLAEEADSSARADFAAGTGDFLTLLTTQTKVARSRAQLATIHRLRLENRVNLHLALGGDF